MNFDTQSEGDLVEAVLRKIWMHVLECSSIGADSDFFQLGGNSIKLLNILFRVGMELGVELGPAVLFENSTFGDFSRLVRAAKITGELEAVEDATIEII